MARFVVLRHEMPPGSDRPTHWDLMLEFDGGLRTWSLDSPPNTGVVIKAKALPDHRIEFLDYEGPVSRDRGEVTRWDGGEVKFHEMQIDRCEAALHGTKLVTRLVAKQSGSADDWQLEFIARKTG